MYQNPDDYYIWGANPHPEDEDYTDPPPRKLPPPDFIWRGINVHERTGGSMPIVCADVIALSYERGGLDLYTFTAWANHPDWGANDPTRYVPALARLLWDHDQIHRWGISGCPELGDMVLSASYAHSGVVVEIQGNAPHQIFVAQASYSKGFVNRMDLAQWQMQTGGDAYFGHPDPSRR